jgi:hypothetical protein
MISLRLTEQPAPLEARLTIASLSRHQIMLKRLRAVAES